MKKSDLALLILIVAISLGASYFAGRAILAQFVQRDTQVEVTEVINSALVLPSEDVFNEQAINPAVPINIGTSNNQQPFGR